MAFPSVVRILNAVARTIVAFAAQDEKPAVIVFCPDISTSVSFKVVRPTTTILCWFLLTNGLAVNSLSLKQEKYRRFGFSATIRA